MQASLPHRLKMEQRVFSSGRTLCTIVFTTLCVLLCSQGGMAQRSIVASNGSVKTAEFDIDVQNFLEKELGTHLGAIASLSPAPERILGVPTTGEFSWGTFMRSLAAYADSSGKRELAGRDLPKWIGQIGLIEAHAGSKAF